MTWVTNVWCLVGPAGTFSNNAWKCSKWGKTFRWKRSLRCCLPIKCSILQAKDVLETCLEKDWYFFLSFFLFFERKKTEQTQFLSPNLKNRFKETNISIFINALSKMCIIISKCTQAETFLEELGLRTLEFWSWGSYSADYWVKIKRKQKSWCQ